MVRLSGNASTALPAMSVTIGSIVFVGQVTIISLFVIFFHCNINNSHVFCYNRINLINFYVFVAGESAVEAYSCILHMFFSFFCSSEHLLPLLFLRRSLVNSQCHFRQTYLFILSTVFTFIYLIICCFFVFHDILTIFIFNLYPTRHTFSI